MRHCLLVYSRSVPGKDAIYNDWYSGQHLSDLLRIPGIVSARRCKFSAVQLDSAAVSPAPYLAIYELDTDDLQRVLDTINSRNGTDEMILSDAIDMSSISTAVFEIIAESIARKDDLCKT